MSVSQMLSSLDRVSIGTRANTYPAGMGDRFLNTYYDTLDVPTAIPGQDFGLFINPQSGTKPLSKTNMQLGGQFALGTDFLVGRVGLRVGNLNNTPVTPAFINDVFRFFENTTVAFKLSGKESLGQWPALEWLGTLNVVTTNTDPVSVQSGTTSTLWKDISELPIILQAQAQWSVRLIVNPAFTIPANLYCKVLLWGVEQRVSV